MVNARGRHCRELLDRANAGFHSSTYSPDYAYCDESQSSAVVRDAIAGGKNYDCCSSTTSASADLQVQLGGVEYALRC